MPSSAGRRVGPKTAASLLRLPLHDLDPVPLLHKVFVGEGEEAGFGRLIFFFGGDAAVINGELREVGQDAQGELGGPGVAPELEGRALVQLEIDGRLLGFQKELARAADAETVVRSFGDAADLDAVFVDDIFIGYLYT